MIVIQGKKSRGAREEPRRERRSLFCFVAVVLWLWSDPNRRTPIDVFITEPFDLAEEYRAAQRQKVAEHAPAPVISYRALLQMKLAAGRAKDLLDVEQLQKLDPY